MKGDEKKREREGGRGLKKKKKKKKNNSDEDIQSVDECREFLVLTRERTESSDHRARRPKGESLGQPRHSSEEETGREEEG